MATSEHILFFNQISISDIGKVGGKNASLGEMYNQLNPMGINIPNGFAVTAEGYRLFRKANNLEKTLEDLLFSLDIKRVFQSFLHRRKSQKPHFIGNNSRRNS